MDNLTGKNVAHFVYLNAGEKLFIITDDVAGESDWHQVVEIIFPTIADEFGNQYFDPKQTCRQEAIHAYELNQLCNMTDEYEDEKGHLYPSRSRVQAIADDVVNHETEEPYVSIPLRVYRKYMDLLEQKYDREDLAKLGVEEA